MSQLRHIFTPESIRRLEHMLIYQLHHHHPPTASISLNLFKRLLSLLFPIIHVDRAIHRHGFKAPEHHVPIASEHFHKVSNRRGPTSYMGARRSNTGRRYSKSGGGTWGPPNGSAAIASGSSMLKRRRQSDGLTSSCARQAYGRYLSGSSRLGGRNYFNGDLFRLVW